MIYFGDEAGIRSVLVGVSGLGLLDDTALPPVYLQRVNSLRSLIEAITAELCELEAPVQKRLRDHAEYQAIQRIPGVGPVLGAVLVAEIGDATRFRDAAALCSWAGCWAGCASVVAGASPRWRWPGGSSPSSTTVCGTARSGLWPGPPDRPPDGSPDQARCVLARLSGPRKARPLT